MINENDRGLTPAPLLQFDAASPANDLRGQMHAAVSEVLFIENEDWTPGQAISGSYTGTLIMESEAAYDRLDERFKALNHTPMLAEADGKQIVRAIRGRINVRPRAWWPNALLLALTVLCLLLIGASTELFPRVLETPDQLLLGLPYAIGILLILGSHELGHYFAARIHKVAVSLPYFIPLPDAFGTLGAFIQLREPMRNRKVLLDIGAAGPLIGLLFAIPVLIIGLKTSPVEPTPIMRVFSFDLQSTANYASEGNSILYAAIKILVFGEFLPNGMTDVSINQLTLAGWVGLLVTGLNLIPVGQLDGGHVIYSLIGERARLLYIPVLVALGVASINYPTWILWLFLLLLLGRVYATPLDSVTRLNPARRAIAVLALVMFIVVFMPIPLQGYNNVARW
jgi:hypothetical protein